MIARRFHALSSALAALVWLGFGTPTPLRAAESWGGVPQLCRALRFSGERADWLGSTFSIDGHAKLDCGSLMLVAHHLNVVLDDHQRLLGASAEGEVALVEGLRLIIAPRLHLDGPAMTGEIEGATLAVRRAEPQIRYDSRGIPEGSNEVTAHGSLRRHRSGRLSLEPADITLCDCGPGNSPSWRLDASRVVVVPNERAFVMWPKFSIWLPKLGLTAVTPPLLPISFPLKSRAWGFLPPQLAFLGPPYPTVDLPVFVPMGPSFDLTLSPGVRTDWAFAPRLGARFRFFPTVGVEGEAWAQWTHDYAHKMASLAFAKETRINPALRLNPTYLAYAQERETLIDRVALGYSHRVSWGEQDPAHDGSRQGVMGSWLTHGSWVSDDLVNSDLMVHPSERVATYLPSRTQLLLRHPRWVATIGAEHLLRLDNVMTEPGTSAFSDLSNVRGAERTTLHRLPFAHLVLPILALIGPLRTDLSILGSRYSTWHRLFGERPGDQPLALLHLSSGADIARAIGPLRLRLRAGGDVVVFSTPNGSAGDAAPVVDAELSSTAAKAYDTVVHGITPSVTYRSFVRTHAPSPLTVAAGEDILDEHLVRRNAQQLRLGLRQMMWRRQHLGGRAIGSIDIEIPFDLQHRTWLQPLISVRLLQSPFGNGFALVSIDPHRSGSTRIRDLQVGYTAQWGPLALWANYLRIAPDADRFERGMYELSAPRHQLLPDTGLLWAHILRSGGQMAVGETLQLNYSLSAQLPRPNIDPASGDPACPLGSGGRGRRCVTSHSAGLRYVSPCRCWSFEASATAAPQDIWHTLRVQMVLSIAGIALGANNS